MSGHFRYILTIFVLIRNIFINQSKLTILNKTDKDLIISDKYNSEFEPLKSGEDSLGQTYTTYYAHIPNFDSSYSLTVNGTEIVLQKP